MAHYRESFIFRIETNDPATFWSGHGDLLLPPDLVLPDVTRALGGGDLVNLPDLEQLINGTAQRAEVRLSGVSVRTVALATEEGPQVQGAPIYIGRIEFNEAWQQAAPVSWEWNGEGRGLTVAGEQGGDGRTRSITLKLAAGDTTRSRAALAFFTDADQRRNFPDDPVFSHVASLNAGSSRRWGPRSD